MTTKIISKKEFDDYEPHLRLFTHEHERRYGCLELTGSARTLAFSWRSDIIDPCVIVNKADSVVWIGVDERLAAVTNDGQILFSLALSSQLLNMELKKGKIVAVCELQAIVINENGSIKAIFDFPDAVDDFNMADTSLCVSFSDGNSAEFSI